MGQTNFGTVGVSDGYTSPVVVSPYGVSEWDTWIAGGQTVGTMKQEIVMGSGGTITDVRAYIETAPTGSTFVVDLMKNGVTMFTTSGNRPTIAAGANASSTTLPDVVAFAAGDRLRIDVIQVGSTVAGSNLACTVTYKRLTSA